MHSSFRSTFRDSSIGRRAIAFAAACLCTALPAQKQRSSPAQPFLRLERGGFPRAGLPAEVGGAGPMIERALQWLRRQQEADGRWRATDRDVATTGLALLALVREGVPAKDRAAIERGAHWLVKEQQDNGLLGTNQHYDFVYAHSMGTLGLCAAVAATESPQLRAAAQKALDYLEWHRNPYAVWRHAPRDQDNDTSVTTWAMLAHRSAHDLGLKVNGNQALLVAIWLEQVTDAAGRAGYTKLGDRCLRTTDDSVRFLPHHDEAMTAAGLLCRTGLGQDEISHPVTRDAAGLLLARPPEWRPDQDAVDPCHWFFASEAIRDCGEGLRGKWGPKLVAALAKGQRHDASFAGSWDPVAPWTEDGGRIYSTALSVLALQSLYPLPRVPTKFSAK